MKKQIFVISLSALLVFSMAIPVFAASIRKGNYVMKYDLYSATVSGASGAGALTAEDSGNGADVFAFVSLFSYKGSTVKNSTSDTKGSYVSVAIPGKGGNTFKSYHNLKDENYNPIGELLTLTK